MRDIRSEDEVDIPYYRSDGLYPRIDWLGYIQLLRRGYILPFQTAECIDGGEDLPLPTGGPLGVQLRYLIRHDVYLFTY